MPTVTWTRQTALDRRRLSETAFHFPLANAKMAAKHAGWNPFCCEIPRRASNFEVSQSHRDWRTAFQFEPSASVQTYWCVLQHWFHRVQFACCAKWWGCPAIGALKHTFRPWKSPFCTQVTYKQAVRLPEGSVFAVGYHPFRSHSFRWPGLRDRSSWSAPDDQQVAHFHPKSLHLSTSTGLRSQFLCPQYKYTAPQWLCRPCRGKSSDDCDNQRN